MDSTVSSCTVVETCNVCKVVQTWNMCSERKGTGEAELGFIGHRPPTS